MQSRNTIAAAVIMLLLLFVLSSGCLKPEFSTYERGIPAVNLTNLSENITRLTTDPGTDEKPEWSEDGKRIFFESRPDLGFGSYGQECYISVMDTSGSNLIRLANGTKPALYLDKIFFQDTHYPYIDLWTMNTDGDNRKKLSSLNATLNFNPTISPDGTKLSYYTMYHIGYNWVKWKNGTWTRVKQTDSIFHNYPGAGGECREARAHIFVMDTDGGNKIRIASDIDLSCRYNSNLKWSPDSKNMLFETSAISPENSIENVDIWIIGVDGGNKKQLTYYQEYDSDPAWNPDGNKIAYRSGNLSYFDIWTMNPDGGDKKQLTTGALITDFDWSPDGKRMAYVSWLTKEPKATEIWIMDADGSNKELLLSVPYDHYPVGDLAWNPDGSKIAFDMMDVVNGVNSDVYAIEVQNGKQG